MAFLQPLASSFQQCLSAGLPHPCEDDTSKVCFIDPVEAITNPQFRCPEVIWRTTSVTTGLAAGAGAIFHTAYALNPQRPLATRINELATGAIFAYIAYQATVFGLAAQSE